MFRMQRAVERVLADTGCPYRTPLPTDAAIVEGDGDDGEPVRHSLRIHQAACGATASAPTRVRGVSRCGRRPAQPYPERSSIYFTVPRSKETPMPESPFQSGPVDLARVDLTEAHDFHYWTARFACTPQQLIDALRSAGVNAAAVGRYFASARCAAGNDSSS